MVQLHLLIHRVSYFRCLYNEKIQYPRALSSWNGNIICFFIYFKTTKFLSVMYAQIEAKDEIYLSLSPSRFHLALTR